MRRLVRFTCDDVRPGRAEVLRRMQMPEDTPVSARLEALEGAAATAFEKLARPVGVFEAVSAEEFLRLYADARGSAGDTPLHHVVPRAGALALFAATLGAGVDAEIRQRFRAGDAPSGWALDAFASAAAERVADRLGECYRLALGDTGPAPGLRVLPYSPGYCGWDVSGQAALFLLRRLEQPDALQPRGHLRGQFVLLLAARAEVAQNGELERSVLVRQW